MAKIDEPYLVELWHLSRSAGVSGLHARRVWCAATYEKQRDLILLGAYQYGTDPKTDYAIDKIEAVEEFLRQRTEENMGFDEAIQRMISLFD